MVAGSEQAGAGAEAADRERRLVTWKEIAHYLGRDEKTARRWEAERGLPVYRAPGTARSTVYARPGEIEAWLRSRGPGELGPRTAPAPGPEASIPAVDERAPRSPWRRWRWGAAGAALVAVAILAGVLAWSRGPGPASRDANALELQAMREWSLRTPASLDRALDLFTQALVRDPSDARAYGGLADCYLLLREYSAVPQLDAYAKAEAAARRAVALDPRLSLAHADLGFALGWGRWDGAGAEREFAQAVALDGRQERAWHWRATWRLSRGDVARALSDIDRAQALAPESDAVAADRALILFFAGRTGEAVQTLQTLERERPEFQSSHSYLAQIRMAQRDWPAWLDEAQAVARLRRDPAATDALEAGATAFRTGGAPAMWAAIVAVQERQRAAGQLPPLTLAASYAQAGRPADALEGIRAAVAAHDPDVMSLPTAVAFTPLHGDARFRRLADGQGA